MSVAPYVPFGFVPASIGGRVPRRQKMGSFFARRGRKRARKTSKTQGLRSWKLSEMGSFRKIGLTRDWRRIGDRAIPLRRAFLALRPEVQQALGVAAIDFVFIVRGEAEPFDAADGFAN